MKLLLFLGLFCVALVAFNAKYLAKQLYPYPIYKTEIESICPPNLPDKKDIKDTFVAYCVFLEKVNSEDTKSQAQAIKFAKGYFSNWRIGRPDLAVSIYKNFLSNPAMNADKAMYLIAKVELAESYRLGYGIKKDKAEALEIYKELATKALSSRVYNKCDEIDFSSTLIYAENKTSNKAYKWFKDLCILPIQEYLLIAQNERKEIKHNLMTRAINLYGEQQVNIALKSINN